jgi:integrase
MSTPSDTFISKSTGTVKIIPGLTLRRGKKKSTYTLRHTQNGKRTNTILGTWPSLPVKDAIREAKSIQRGDQREPTWGAMLRQYTEKHPLRSNEQTLAQVELHFGSILALKPSKIQKRDVFDTIESIPLAPSTRLKLVNFASKAGKWSQARGLCDNPIGAFVDYNRTLKDENKIAKKSDFRDGRLTPDAIKQTYSNLRRSDDRAAFVLYLLTGLRKEELRLLKQTDIADDMLTIPGTRRKNGKALTQPLTAATRACLSSVASSPYIFPVLASESPSAFTGRLKTASSGHTPHDLRRTCAGILRELGAPTEVIARLLGHTLPGAAIAPTITYLYTGGPTKHDDNAAAKWLTKLANFLENLLTH